MMKITEISEIQEISEPEIRKYIFRKATKMMQEYNVENLDNIGCFVVLENSENQLFEVAEMEFTEVLEIGNLHYLHGVKILGERIKLFVLKTVVRKLFPKNSLRKSSELRRKIAVIQGVITEKSFTC